MKRFMDIGLALLGVLLLCPIFLVIAILVRRDVGSPVLFVQLRPGKGGHPFKILKFRTMTDECDMLGNRLADADRLTKLGSWLRATSLDELPELWNVIMGDMSFVGPRPLLMEYLPLYTTDQARRHDVLPGITGWAQVHGRNALSWEEKFALDVWYVDNMSLGLDIRILFMTVRKVLLREGICSAGHVTMPRFKGPPHN